MQDEGIDLIEAPFVEEEGNTFTGGELTLLVLAVDTLLTTTKVRLGTKLYELLNFL